MQSSEERSLIRFLAIYLSSTFILFFLATFIFYTFQKHQIIDNQTAELVLKSEQIIKKLRVLHETYGEPLLYPNSTDFDSAIYDVDKKYIFGTKKISHIHWQKEYYREEKNLFYIHSVEPHYLGATHLVVSQNINEEPLNELINMALLFLFVAGIIFTLLGLFLGKLFTAPMKESIETMNKFIEDTTHELNTPISTILTNIELLESIHDCSGKQEMRRLEIASKTLSRIYEDLTYLKLNHNYHRRVVSLNISTLLEERIEFFHTLIEAKELKLTQNILPEISLEMDKNDALRLIDNLLSNAIKYNKKFGKLNVILREEGLEISNEGLGIKRSEINLIKKRFRRANSSEGGFGIGLDIISQVVERYGFKFHIKSIYREETKVEISW